jgi:hypothetical protein
MGTNGSKWELGEYIERIIGSIENMKIQKHFQNHKRPS